MHLYLDIETLPSADPEVEALLAAKIAPPANYSKPETIAKWEQENKPALVKEALAKTSFDGLFGRIACICWAFDDGPVHSTSHDATERAALNALFVAVGDAAKLAYHGGTAEQGITIVGHNVAGFDLQFIKHRSIIHGIRPPAPLFKAMSAKAWDNCIADTMLMWSSDRERRASMDKLCKALGIPGKGDFDGSMVAETWPNDPQKVIDYCKDDVERTRRIYKRLTFQLEAA